MLAGDTPVVVGDTLQVWRAGVLVESRTLTTGPVVELTPLAEAKTISELYFYKDTKMPGINVAVTGVATAVNGVITFKTSDGENEEFVNWEAFKDSCVDVDTDGAIARKIARAMTVARSPDGSNKTNMVTGSVAINMQGSTPIIVTPPLE